MKQFLKRFSITTAILISAFTPSFANNDSAIDVLVNNNQLYFEDNPYVIDGTTMVPMRFIFESLGASIDWDPITSTVTATRNDVSIQLSIDSDKAYVNNQPVQIGSVPRLVNNRTFIPLRFISETLNSRVVWDHPNRDIYIDSVVPLEHISMKRYINNRYVSGNIIKFDSKDPNLKLSLGLANDRVYSETEELGSIASRHNAIAAINGSYFDAGSSIKEPLGVLFHNGQLVHKGYQNRTAIGVDTQNNIDFSVVTFEDDISKGSINGSYDGSNFWHAKWLNRTALSEYNDPIIFTPARGPNTDNYFGQNIIVSNGQVVGFSEGNSYIPYDGFVINLNGVHANNYLHNFKIGDQVAYSSKLIVESQNYEFWNNVDWALEAGPTLLRDGKSVQTPEEFNESHFYGGLAVRSSIGTSDDGLVYMFVTTSTVSLNELRALMLYYGVDDAINLDGGGSSGLYYYGNYYRKPYRKVSNAILLQSK